PAPARARPAGGRRGVRAGARGSSGPAVGHDRAHPDPAGPGRPALPTDARRCHSRPAGGHVARRGAAGPRDGRPRLRRCGSPHLGRAQPPVPGGHARRSARGRVPGVAAVRGDLRDVSAAYPGAVNEDTQPQPTTDEDEAVIALAHSLLDAARTGDSAALLSLIDQGAPVDLRDGAGNSPLMLAAYHGHAALVRELAARGADVDLANDRGQSPLAGAAFKGFTEVATALLEAGADPRLGTPSALETARYFERAEIVALLDAPRG